MLLTRQLVTHNRCSELGRETVIHRKNGQGLVINLVKLFGFFVNLFTEFEDGHLKGPHLFFNLDIGLGCRHKALFALEKEVLTALLIGSGNEFLSEIIHESLAGPPFTAIHTVSILRCVTQVTLGTARTHIKLTEGTLDARMVRLVK